MTNNVNEHLAKGSLVGRCVTYLDNGKEVTSQIVSETISGYDMANGDYIKITSIINVIH
jgi:hypothetical protein